MSGRPAPHVRPTRPTCPADPPYGGKMTSGVKASEFSQLGLADWRVVRSGIEANFQCGSYAEAGRFAADVATVCDEHDHHASIDLRYPGLVHLVSTTHYLNGLTDRDVALARAVSAMAGDRGYSSHPDESMALEIALDVLDVSAVRPFWQTVRS